MDLNVDLDGLFRQNLTYDYNNDYEYKEDFDQRSIRSVWIPVVYSFILAVGLLGNLLLLAVLAQKRRSWRTSDTFILHLSVADVLLLGTLPFRAAEAAGGCSQILCKICGAVFNMNFFCGIFLLACVGVDHFLSTVHGLQVFSHSNPGRVHLSCLCVWLLSLLLAVPDWMFLISEEVTVHWTECSYSYAGSPRLWSRLFHHALGFILPAVLLTLCCSSVLLQLQCNLKTLQKQKSALLILPLVVLFFLCWMPYNFTLIVDTVTNSSKENTSLKEALQVTAVFGCIHAGLRPLLYLGLCQNFRKRAVATLKCAPTETKGSLWELGVGEEAVNEQNQAAEELKQMTNVEQKATAQC